MDHRDDCTRRTHGLGCNCEVMAAREQVQTKINASRREVPQGLPDVGTRAVFGSVLGGPSQDQGDDHEDQCMARHPGFGCTCEQIQFEDRQREVAAEQSDGPDPEQLCFAISTKTGTLMTRDGRPLWTTRKLWERFPAVAQVIPINGAPPIGSMALDSTHQPPDVVGQLIEQLDRLDRQTVEGAKAVQLLGTIAAKGAEGLENLSLIISQRIHFVELLDRAAAMIDPDRPEGTASYEARLDWLAKWREVVGR